MSYVTQSPDISPEADRAYFQMLREAGPQRRFQLGREQTRSAIRQARGRIARQHPEWSEIEVALHWAELAYGEEIANRVREELDQRKATAL